MDPDAGIAYLALDKAGCIKWRSAIGILYNRSILAKLKEEFLIL